MGAYTLEEFADVIPNENTYMSQICSKIFTFNNSTISSPELAGVVESTCHDWFTQALQHCTEIIFVPTETSIKTWLVHQIYNLQFIIFPMRPITSLVSTLPHIKVNPYRLKREDCNQLFIEIAKDYIDIAPKYNYCVEDSFFFLSIFKGVVCLLMIAMLYLYSRGLAAKSGKYFDFLKRRVHSSIDPEKKAILEKMRLISGYSLRTQRFDRKHLKVLPDLYDYPKIAIRVKKKSFSDALCCLVKSEPTVEKFKNEILVQQPFKKERRYLLHKLNGFLNKSGKCRLIIDVNLDSSSESEEETSKVRSRFSGGDFSTSACENTADDSNLDTSSACSGVVTAKNRPPRLERHYAGKRYFKTQDGTKIPTIFFGRKYTPCVPPVTEKASSTSIALIDSKNSSPYPLKPKKGSINRARRVKVSNL